MDLKGVKARLQSLETSDHFDKITRFLCESNGACRVGISKEIEGALSIYGLFRSWSGGKVRIDGFNIVSDDIVRTLLAWSRPNRWMLSMSGLEIILSPRTKLIITIIALVIIDERAVIFSNV